MQHSFKFSSPQTYRFRSNTHQDVSENLVRVIMGSHQAFAKSFDAQTIYNQTNFLPALERAYSDYRNEYRTKKSTEYPKDNSYIISRFVQMNLTEEGELSVFAFGRTQVGYLRAGKVNDVSSGKVLCQPDDLVFINIEANPYFDPLVLLSASDNNALENYHFPVFFVKIEGKSVSSKTATEGSIVISQKVPKSFWKSFLIVGSLALLSAAGWWQLSRKGTNLIPTDSTATAVVGLEDSTITMDESLGIVDSETPTSDFPITDSLLNAYYQSTPRTLTDLNKIEEALNKEQNNNPTAAQAKWQEVKDEQKELLLKLLEPLDVILNNAENAYRENMIEEYKGFIGEAEGFLNDTIIPQWLQLPLVQKRYQRLQRIKSYDKEVDINQR